MNPCLAFCTRIFSRDNKENHNKLVSVSLQSVSKYVVCCLKIVYIVYPKYSMTGGKVSFITSLPDMFLFYSELKTVCV